jgi:hypothetical protein
MEEFSFGNLDDIVENSFEPIAPGLYTLRAVNKEMRDTKTGGNMLAVEFEVVDGAFAERRIFQNFNLVNANTTAVEIALRDIKSWLVAAGLPASGALTMAKVDSLEGLPFTAKVVIEKDKTGQYDDRNTIKRFVAPKSGAPVGVPTTAPPAPAAAPAAAPADRKPWE